VNRRPRRRRRQTEERPNHEAWAIPYADLMTLLLAFFVVMYAISSLNTGKYRVLADALSVAFNGEGPDAEPDVLPGSTVTGLPSLEELNAGRIAMRIARATAPLVMNDQLTIRQHPMWVEVEIRNDVLFASGSATLNPDAERVLSQLAETLTGFGNSIRVEGHTDDVPIQGGLYRDNWDLSAARAGAVVRVLVAKGLEPSRFAVLGFGEHRPLQSNDSEAGRSANRRVLLAILGQDEVAEGPYGMNRGDPSVGPKRRP
jgi:chemotaxis protein MotB